MNWSILERYDLFEAMRGSESGCVLVGPSGIGKSTAAAHASAEPPAMTIVGLPGLDGIPYAALPALDSATEDTIVEETHRVLGALRDAGGTIAIDDPALLDADTAHLMADEIERGLRAVITHRPDQPPPPVLVAAIAAVGMPTIEIGPLDASMVDLALETALGAPIATATTELLATLTGGNPMLLREMATDLDARGAFRRDPAGELEIQPDAVQSRRLSELLRSRLPADPEDRQLLQVIAASGHLPLDVVTLLAGADDETPGTAPPGAERAEALLRSDWLVLDEPWVRIAHPAMVQALDEEHGPFEQRALLRRARRHLDASPTSLSNEGRLTLVRWALDTDEAVAAEELAWAQHEAQRLFDTDLACAIASRRARDGSVSTTVDLAVTLSQAGRFDDAVAALSAAADRVAAGIDGDDAGGTDRADLGDVTTIARLIIRLAGPAARFMSWGTPEPGLDERIATWADALAGGSAHHDLLAGFDALYSGRVDEARAAAARVREHGDPRLATDADEITLFAALYDGRHSLALEAIDRLRLSLSDPALRIPVTLTLDTATSTTLLFSGRAGDALDFDRRVLASATETHAYGRIRDVSRQLGITAMFAGRINESIESLQRYLDNSRSRDRVQPYVHASLAHALALHGDLPGAEVHVARSQREADRVPDIMQADHQNLIGMTLGLLGRDDEAERSVRGAFDAAVAFGMQRSIVLGGMGLTRLARITAADLEVLEATCAAIDPADLTAIQTAGLLAARGMVHGDALELVDAARAYADAGSFMPATEAIARAIALAARSDPAATGRWRAQRDEYLEQTDGLANRWAFVDPGIDPLSPRELEIAGLAAGGLTNGAIAERLGISDRTVDNTVHRAFTKLGIHQRGDLVSALMGAPTPAR